MLSTEVYSFIPLHHWVWMGESSLVNTFNGSCFVPPNSQMLINNFLLMKCPKLKAASQALSPQSDGKSPYSPASRQAASVTFFSQYYKATVCLICCSASPLGLCNHYYFAGVALPVKVFVCSSFSPSTCTWHFSKLTVILSAILLMFIFLWLLLGSAAQLLLKSSENFTNIVVNRM